MGLRQVDVRNKAGVVLQTYPITLPGTDPVPKTADYERAALAAAAKARLVPAGAIADLTARMHPFEIGASFVAPPIRAAAKSPAARARAAAKA